jgi:RHS repeat-associated protein
VVHHTYDVFGRLAETLTPVDDGVRREVYYWDGAALARRQIFDHATDACIRDERYLYDPEREHVPLMRVLAHADDATQYFTTDQRGAATRLSDADGAALWEGRYDPYGRCLSAGAEEQPIRLSGQLEVGATGLRHHAFRVYDAELSRFLSPDPLGIVAGHNPYAYPTDPIAWNDPLGLMQCVDGGRYVIDDDGTVWPINQQRLHQLEQIPGLTQQQRADLPIYMVMNRQNTDLALGLNMNAIRSWSDANGYHTIGQYQYPDSMQGMGWGSQMHMAMTNSDNIHFNTGQRGNHGEMINPAAADGTLNAQGNPANGYTNYEMHLLQNNPHLSNKLTQHGGGPNVLAGG